MDNSKYIGGECLPDKWMWVPSFLKNWSFDEQLEEAPTQTTQGPSSTDSRTSPTYPGNPSLPIPATPLQHHPSPKTKKGLLYLSNILVNHF